MRIPTLLQKISELAAQPERRTVIDVDLMMDYTRVLYADLLEWRGRLPATIAAQSIAPQPAVPGEPTLAEVAEAMEKRMPVVQEAIPVAVAEQTPPATPPPTSNIQPPASNAKDIRALIGINDKYQIMSELFGNDKKAYEQTLDFINQSNNESVAMHWLREQLWITEERSDAAVGFFEIVGRFFKG